MGAQSVIQHGPVLLVCWLMDKVAVTKPGRRARACSGLMLLPPAQRSCPIFWQLYFSVPLGNYPSATERSFGGVVNQGAGGGYRSQAEPVRFCLWNLTVENDTGESSHPRRRKRKKKEKKSWFTLRAAACRDCPLDPILWVLSAAFSCPLGSSSALLLIVRIRCLLP